MIGVVPQYKLLRKRLAAERCRLAPLQLLGKIEDLLTKEFATSILLNSKGKTLPLLNVGKSADERRIDVALASGDIADRVDKTKLRIWGFLELKYIRNRHRIGDANALDELEPTFRSLHTQLKRLDVAKFGGYRVNLRGGIGDTYGLVFASFVTRADQNGDPELFLNSIQSAARGHGFQTHNFKPPKLYSVYEGVPVTVLGGKYSVSLYSGLWRLSAGATCSCDQKARAAKAYAL